MSTSTKSTRRGILAAFPAIVTAMAPSAATALNALAARRADDPIFAAIEAHKAQRARIDALADDEDIEDELGHEEWEAFWSLLETPPTTIAGFAAMFAYLAKKNESGDCKLIPAINNWSGIPPGETEHLHAAEWLEMLAAAMRKLQAEARS